MGRKIVVSQKNIEIQLLRVVAILMVLIIHAPVGMFSPYAHKYSILLTYIHPAVGVDIFFVLSGYLMGVTFLDRTKGNEDLSEKLNLTARFYLRRFWRLFPASFFWITVTLIVGVISRDPELWLNPLALYKAWIASVLNIRNFEVSLNPTHLGYYWSLSLENQFYFFLPLTWFFIDNKWFWRSTALLCGVFIFWRPGHEMWWLFRFDGLLMGLIVYKLTTLESFRDAIRLISPYSAVGKTAMTTFICLTLPAIPIAIGAYPALSWSIVVLFSSLLASQAALNEGLIYVPKILHSPIYWIGELSYSIYLCHIPVWLILKDLAKRDYVIHNNFYLLFIIGIVSILLLSVITYFCIELPCKKFGKPKRVSMNDYSENIHDDKDLQVSSALKT